MVDKIGYTRPPVSPSRTGGVRKTSAATGSQFVDALNQAEGVSSTSGVERASAVAGVSSVGALIGIQEVSEEDVRRKRAIKRGRFTIEALEQLRDGLLTGSLPIATIRNLERLVAEERALTADPRLQSILDDIELRAAVEIAKLEMAGILKANPRG